MTHIDTYNPIFHLVIKHVSLNNRTPLINRPPNLRQHPLAATPTENCNRLKQALDFITTGRYITMGGARICSPSNNYIETDI
jgi:hypothetical protein